MVALACLFLAPSQSRAETVTIGSSLPDNSPTTFVISCGSACTTALGEINDRPVASPCDGTVVRWRLRIAQPGGGTAQPIALRIVRAAAGGQFVGAGTSASHTLSTVAGEIQQFTATLAIRRNDSIGLDTPQGASARIVIPNATASLNRFLNGTLGDGEPRPATVNDGFEVLLNADVECAIPPPAPPPVLPPPDPAPGLTSVSMLRSRFRVGADATPRAAAPRRVARRSAFRYRLSEAATVKVSIERRLRGRYRTAGSLTRQRLPGGRSTSFSGRIGRRALPAGRYRATLVATDVAGQHSTARRVSFTILPG